MQIEYLKEDLHDEFDFSNMNFWDDYMICESMGIVGGIADLIIEINNILVNFTIAAKRSPSMFFFERNFAYDNLLDDVKFVSDPNYLNYYEYNIKFKIDPSKNNLSWLSNDTAIDASVVIYDSKIYYEPNNSISSKYDFINGQVVGEIKLNYALTIDKDDYAFKLGGFPINLRYKCPFVHLLQHEFVHLKKDKDLNSDLYNKAYDRIIQLKSNSSISGRLAYGLYRYCIRDEKSAFINQFYKEYDFQNLKSSEIYNDAIKDYKYFYTFFNRLSDNSSIYQNIYKNLYAPARILFKNQFPNIKNTYEFCDNLIEFILKNIEDMLRRMKKIEKTKHLYESYKVCSWKISRTKQIYPSNFGFEKQEIY